MWSIVEYENQAKKIAQEFVESRGELTINSQAEKVASNNGLNPDGIRTLVRLANVCTFEGLMAKAAEDKDENRMMEFQTGDAEEVLSRLFSTAKIASAAVVSDRNYNRTTDYFSDIPAEIVTTEKVATISGKEKSLPAPTWNVAELRLRLEKTAAKFKEDKLQAEYDWFSSLEKAAAYVRVANSSDELRLNLEKTAAVVQGIAVEPELRMLHNMLRVPKNTPLYAGVKVATVINHYVPLPRDNVVVEPILEWVKQAQVAREKSKLCAAGIQWLKDNV